jgi:hypothetical protein
LLTAVYGQGHRDALFFRDRAEYAAVLAAGDITAEHRARLLAVQDRHMENATEQPRVGLATVNHRLSLTPHLAPGARAAWLSAQQRRLPGAPDSDRLARHQHLLLRALGAHVAGRQRLADDALRKAESAPLYDTPQSQWQRDVQERVAAVLRRHDAAGCRALRAALQQPYAVELVVAARGLSCAETGRSRSPGGADESGLEAVVE